MDNRILETKNWYVNYYKKNPFRNSLRLNSGVLFQILATEASVVKSISAIKKDPTCSSVLNVGCGNGSDIYQLIRLDYALEKITGIDIDQERLSIANNIFPNAKFVLGDASLMNFPDNHFDLVYESTMFATLPDDSLCKSTTVRLRGKSIAVKYLNKWFYKNFSLLSI